MDKFLTLLAILCAAFVLIIGLLQKGMGDGLSNMFSGNKDLALFAVQKERGADKALSIAMLVFGLGLAACLIALQFQ